MLDIWDPFQVSIKDVIYLTKNSVKELKEEYLPDGMNADNFKKMGSGKMSELKSKFVENEIESPLTNVFGASIPIDALISYDVIDRDTNNVTNNQIVGRFASFSPIFMGEVTGNFGILPTDGCRILNETEFDEFSDKILVVLRGNCSFANKIQSIINSDLNPRAIIIANSEPLSHLITMYSAQFESRFFNFPIIFISYESFQMLQNVEEEDPILTISTILFGSWVNVILSIIFSPLLLILILIVVIRCVSLCEKRRKNFATKRLVEGLPIYIYNVRHLVNVKDFDEYRECTGLQDQAEQVSEMLNASSRESISSSAMSAENFCVGGIDVRLLRPKIDILISPDDFFTSLKCSICLEKYIPLQSKVMVLNCKHFFHETCLSNWLINFKRTCPLCCIPVKSLQRSHLLTSSMPDYGSVNSELEQQPDTAHLRVSLGHNTCSMTTTGLQSSIGTQNTQREADVSDFLVISAPLVITSPNSITEDTPHTNTDFVVPKSSSSTLQSRETTASEASFHSARTNFSSASKLHPFAKPSLILSQFSKYSRPSTQGYFSSEEVDRDSTSVENLSDSTLHLANLSNVS